MPIDTKRWAQKKADVDRKLKERQEGNMWTKIEEGEYLLYVHPLVYPKDKHPHTSGFNFIEVMMHYDLGGNKNAQLCLDYKANPILSHPLLQGFVANREKNAFKISPDMKCEVCQGLDSGDIKNKKNKQQLKWFLGWTPMWFRKEAGESWVRLKFKPRFYISGPQIFNGYMKALIDLSGDEIDPMDPNAAVFMKLTRTGTDFNSTEYACAADIGSARKPVRLDKMQREILSKAVRPKGDLDLFMIVSSFAKSPRQISDLIAGVTERNADDEAAEQPRECFGKSWTDDEECAYCESNIECMKACGAQPKKVGTKTQSKPTRTAATSKRTQPKKEVDEQPPEAPPEESEYEQTTPDEKPYESSMECFGNYLDTDEACKTCDEADQCRVNTSDAVEQPESDELPEDDEPPESDEPPEPGDADDSTPDDEQDDLPNCYRQYELGDDDCEQCDVNERCAADSEVDDSNSQVDEPPEPDAEDDPDVAKLEEEAKRLANKSKSGRKGKK